MCDLMDDTFVSSARDNIPEVVCVPSSPNCDLRCKPLSRKRTTFEFPSMGSVPSRLGSPEDVVIELVGPEWKVPAISEREPNRATFKSVSEMGGFLDCSLKGASQPLIMSSNILCETHTGVSTILEIKGL